MRSSITVVQCLAGVAVRGYADMEEERAKEFMHKFGYPRSQSLLTILGSDKLSLDGPWLSQGPPLHGAQTPKAPQTPTLRTLLA